MTQSGQEATPEQDAFSTAILVVLALLVLVGLMYYSYTYDYPNGPITWTEFALFWLRELIILGIAIIGLVAICVVRISKYLQNRRDMN